MIILLQELKYYFKNKLELVYLSVYLLSIILLVPFTMEAGDEAMRRLAPLVIWLALAGSSTQLSASLFRRDGEAGRLVYFQLLPMPLEWIVFAKWLACTCALFMPLVIALPLVGVLFGLDIAVLQRYALAVGVGSAALCAIGTLAAAITSSIRHAGALLGLMVLPLSIPVLIFGANYCRGGEGMMMLLGITLLMVPLACLAGASAIRAAH